MTITVTLEAPDGVIYKELKGSEHLSEMYGPDDSLTRFIVDGKIRMVCRTADIVLLEVADD